MKLTTLVLLIAPLLQKTGARLLATMLSASLPFTSSSHSAIYDGFDSIFIFGAKDEMGKKSVILHFNLSTSSVTFAGEMPDIGEFGMLTFDGFGNILYLGGGEEGRDVYQFNPKTGICRNLTTLPFKVELNSFINYNETHILIIGGRGKHCKKILSFNIITYESKIFKKTCSKFCKSLVAKKGNKTLIYQWNSSVRLLDIEGGNEKYFPVDVFNINAMSSYVRAGRYVHIIGAQRDNTTENSHKHGIITLDLDTIKLSFFPVEGFVLRSREYFNIAPAAVFVEKFSKIYLFGGGSVGNLNSLNLHKDIWYIDLNPENREPKVSLTFLLGLLTVFLLIVVIGCLSHYGIHKGLHKRSGKGIKETNRVWKSPQSLQLLPGKPIGRGSVTEVYKAKHSLHLQLHFAIKRIKICQPREHRQCDFGNVLKEFEHLSEIYNSNVVRLWNCWIEDEKGTLVVENALKTQRTMDDSPHYFLFLQMEFCDSTLRDWIEKNETSECRLENDVKKIMAQIVNGLRAIHKRGIIHRNIKPSNILYCENGKLWKIGDFGLSAKATETAQQMVTELPETNEKPAKDFFKDDVFTLGLTFLEMICICPRGASNKQLFQQIRTMREEITMELEGFATITSPSLIKLISKMVAVNPTDIFDFSIDGLLS